MNVSIFKNIKDVSNAFDKPVYLALDRIKNGKSRDLVTKIRNGDSEAKKMLPYVCFSGTFSYRNTKGLNEHSGLICLDFDKFKSSKDALEFKKELCEDPYIFSCWISPSGNGVKVLVKIPKNQGDHKNYFNALKTHFNSEYFDISTSDISRACYESYDSDLYLNNDSLLWEALELPEYSEVGRNKKDISIALTSDNAIIENLLTWWSRKYSMGNGERSNNAFKLAIAFNDFGIEENEAKRVLYKYEESDFNKSEIDRLIESAYSKKHNFKTKFFEDVDSKNKIEKLVRNGKTSKEILKQVPSIKEDSVLDAIDSIKDNIQLEDFWSHDEKGKIKLSPHKFKFWLEQNNFYKYFPTDGAFVFIKKERNLIEETDEKRIKDYVLNYLLSRTDIGFAPYDFMASNTKYFTFEFLSFLESIDINLKEDTEDKCYLYFNNCALEITKNGTKEIEYLDLDGYVWKRQVINRDYVNSDHHDSIFRTFIWRLAGEKEDRYNSLKSVIGFMLHSYKTSANNKAIVFNDETISENPNGGSGKSMIADAISKLKRTSIIDGKQFDQTDKFAYQTVNDDTQVLVFDDVKKNFNFENLFSIITGGIKIERKNQGAIKLPISTSPKILITTNYTIGGVGGSFERRKFEIEISAHFGFHHTPLDEFGHMLFDDWNIIEWNKFDNYMIECLKYYLLNGLVKSEYQNLMTRKFIKETNYSFYEWVQDTEVLPVGVKIPKHQPYEAIISDYPDLKKWLTQKKFTQWMEIYAKEKGLILTQTNSNGIRYYKLDNKEKVMEEAPF